MPLELEERERFRFHRLSPEEKEKILEKLEEALSRHEEIMLALVHGSFLKGSSFRDVDIAVYAKNVDPLSYKISLEAELERVIGYPVDVAVINEAPPWLVKRVLTEGRVLLERQQLLLEKLYLKAIDEEHKR